MADDGAAPDVATVLWCTGAQPDFDFIELSVFDGQGRPRHHRGLSIDVPGLGFLGLTYQFALASATVQGMDRDARYLLRRLGRRRRSTDNRPAPATRAA